MLCILTVLLTALPLVSLSVSAQTAIMAKTTINLNLRSGAGTNYSIIKVVPSSETVTVTDKSNPDWIKVRLSDGTTGYCSAQYLDILTDCKTTDYLNFRTGPNTYSSILKTFAPGEQLDILSFSGDSWAKVKASDGTTGYVCTDYVSYLSASSSGAALAVSSQTPAAFALSEKERTLAKDKTFTLTVTGNQGSMTWKTGNGKVATVTAEGEVKGIDVGETVITATDSKTKKSLTCKVKVIKTDYKYIFLSELQKTLEVGQSFTLTGRTSPAGGKFTFISLNTSVATVDQKGVVKAVGVGKGVVRAVDSTGVIYRSCFLTVTGKGTITMKQTEVTIDEGTSATLGIVKTPSNLSVKWTTSDAKIAGVRNGVVSGLRPGTVTITASDESGKVKARCTVTVRDVYSGSVRLSRYSVTTTAGKTIYIKGYNGGRWTTSDSKIATVWDGFIETKAPGRCAISYVDYYGNKAVCVVGVSDPAPVRFAYSSPNSATLNSTVTLVAITDKSRTGVEFTVEDGSTPTKVTATSKTTEGDTYIWKGTYTPKAAGVFIVKTYSRCNDVWSTCADGKCDIYVSDKSDPKETGLVKLRASDQVIKFIGDKEGFVPDVVYDTLAYDLLPTLGHGFVVWEGDKFYNHLTKGEAYALLVKAINEGSFTKDVNSMLISNRIRFNQQQFDALVSFSYNLGTGWTYQSGGLKSILLNSYGPSVTVTSNNSMTGRVTASSGLYLRQAATTSSDVISLMGYNETVTLVSTTKYNGVWYKVKTSSGQTGYCSSTYLDCSSSSTTSTRDLNYVNRNALINEMLAFHHAGGNCYYGLLYRRADELEMFLYNDYAPDGRSNNHNFPNPYCISFP